MDPYAQPLYDAALASVPDWLRRCVTETAVRLTGRCSTELAQAAQTMADEAAPVVLHQLHNLLERDVDDQTTNPLSILRNAVTHPTALLAADGTPPARRDDFAQRAFPDDVYGLSPATWADIDERLVEPGIVWGAWKAKTVLDRRRALSTSPDGDDS